MTTSTRRALLALLVTGCLALPVSTAHGRATPEPIFAQDFGFDRVSGWMMLYAVIARKA